MTGHTPPEPRARLGKVTVHMLNLLIGAVSMVAFIAVVNGTKKQGIRPAAWQWALVVLAFLVAIVVAEIVVLFLEEGATRAALVMGSILGFFTVLVGVVVWRVAFSRPPRRTSFPTGHA